MNSTKPKKSTAANIAFAIQSVIKIIDKGNCKIEDAVEHTAKFYEFDDEFRRLLLAITLNTTREIIGWSNSAIEREKIRLFSNPSI